MDNVIDVKKQDEFLFRTKDEQDWLKSMLRQQSVTVSFTKKDGTVRKMLCTLAESKIPSEKVPKNSGKKQNDESLAVFDVEKQDWRSFRWDSVKRIQFDIMGD